MEIRDLEFAASQAKNMVTFADGNEQSLLSKDDEFQKTNLEWHHKFTNAFAIFVMFLIGAPLGSIIKKGGFGMPIVVAISFFILMYVMTQQGDKMAKEGKILVQIGAWFSNVVLFSIGVYFLNKARNDSRLFETDVYAMAFGKLKERLSKIELFSKILKLKKQTV
ncbi:LptF/LptG family permease [Pseudarcicella hirudinis]